MALIPFAWDTIVTGLITGGSYGTVTLSNQDRTIVFGDNGSSYPAVFATLGQRTGKYYLEFTIVDAGATGAMAVGIQPYQAGGGAIFAPGGQLNTWLYRADGQLVTDGTGPHAYGSAYVNGDIIGMKVDNTALTVEFFKNGISQGVCTNVNTTSDPTGGNCPCVSAADTVATTDTMTVTINGGDDLAVPFIESIPATYEAWAVTVQWDPITFNAVTPSSDWNQQNPLNLINVLSNYGRTSGKFYFEVQETDPNSGMTVYGYVGVVTKGARGSINYNIANDRSGAFTGVACGWGDGTLAGGPGGSTISWTNIGGSITEGILTTSSVAAPITGDTIGCAVDLDNLVVYFFKNGVAIPSGGALPASLSLSGFTEAYPAIGRVSTPPTEFLANFTGPFLVPGGGAPIVNGFQFSPWNFNAPVNPNPVIVSVTIDNSYTVTNVGNAGPTSIPLVNTWWSITLDSLVLRIDEVDGQSFATNHNRTDVWSLPIDAQYKGKSIVFNVQATTGGTIYSSAPFVMTDVRFDYGSLPVPPGPIRPLPPPGTPGPGVYRNQTLDNTKR